MRPYHGFLAGSAAVLSGGLDARERRQLLAHHFTCLGRQSWAQGEGATHVFADSLELFRVQVLPYPFHVIPVCDYAVLQRVVDFEQPPILLRLWADEHVTFQRTCHCPHMFWPADKGRKEAFRQVLTREASSDGAAAVVDNDWRIVESGAHGGGLQWREIRD